MGLSGQRSCQQAEVWGRKYQVVGKVCVDMVTKAQAVLETEAAQWPEGSPGDVGSWGKGGNLPDLKRLRSGSPRVRESWPL